MITIGRQNRPLARSVLSRAGASDPLADRAGDGVADFDRIHASAQANGGCAD